MARETGELIVIEVDTTPSLAQGSLVYQQVRGADRQAACLHQTPNTSAASIQKAGGRSRRCGWRECERGESAPCRVVVACVRAVQALQRPEGPLTPTELLRSVVSLGLLATAKRDEEEDEQAAALGLVRRMASPRLFAAAPCTPSPTHLLASDRKLSAPTGPRCSWQTVLGGHVARVRLLHRRNGGHAPTSSGEAHSWLCGARALPQDEELGDLDADDEGAELDEAQEEELAEFEGAFEDGGGAAEEEDLMDGLAAMQVRPRLPGEGGSCHGAGPSPGGLLRWDACSGII